MIFSDKFVQLKFIQTHPAVQRHIVKIPIRKVNAFLRSLMTHRTCYRVPKSRFRTDSIIRTAQGQSGVRAFLVNHVTWTATYLPLMNYLFYHQGFKIIVFQSLFLLFSDVGTTLAKVYFVPSFVECQKHSYSLENEFLVKNDHI